MNMKKYYSLSLIIVSLFLSFKVNGQSGWQWQNPLPTGNHLHSTFFIDVNTGYTAGDNGSILKTTNGGTRWISQSSGTSNNISDIYFNSSMTGWAIGNDLILNTTNGGENWNSQSSGTSNYLGSIYFISSTTGWVVGYPGSILKTTNGGTNWILPLPTALSIHFE